jgi:hypothetical protein
MDVKIIHLYHATKYSMLLSWNSEIWQRLDRGICKPGIGRFVWEAIERQCITQMIWFHGETNFCYFPERNAVFCWYAQFILLKAIILKISGSWYYGTYLIHLQKQERQKRPRAGVRYERLKSVNIIRPFGIHCKSFQWISIEPIDELNQKTNWTNRQIEPKDKLN